VVVVVGGGVEVQPVSVAAHSKARAQALTVRIEVLRVSNLFIRIGSYWTVLIEGRG
jgi:hypothetical protein